jgi:hypothetical protein
MSTAGLVLVCALELLGRHERTFPPIRIVAQLPLDASPNAEAYVSRSDRSINLVASSPAFVAALSSARAVPACRDREALALVASIVTHEEWHILNGPDEAGAYQAQLITLGGLGYGTGTGPFNRVWQAMIAVTDRP